MPGLPGEEAGQDSNREEEMNGQYILIGQTPVPCEDLLEWAKEFEGMDRRVRLTRVGPYHVSTVFLGPDHSFGSGPPLLFETMVWIPADYDTEFMGKKWHHGREWTDIQDRCSTWSEAEDQHQRIVDDLKRDNPGDPVEEALEEYQKFEAS